GRVAAFGLVEQGRPDRVVIVAELSGTAPPDVIVDRLRKRIGDLFGLYVDEVALVPSGTVGRTTSGKIQRGVTRARYEQVTARDDTLTEQRAVHRGCVDAPPAGSEVSPFFGGPEPGGWSTVFASSRGLRVSSPPVSESCAARRASSLRQACLRRLRPASPAC